MSQKLRLSPTNALQNSASSFRILTNQKNDASFGGIEGINRSDPLSAIVSGDIHEIFLVELQRRKPILAKCEG
jgi:hypothetical protein